MNKSMTIEIMDVMDLRGELLKTCKSHSFRSDGWMQDCVTNLKRGYAINLIGDKVGLKYPTAHVLIARIDDEFAGWGLSRHHIRNGKSDISIWTKAQFRGKGIATDILYHAWNNYGDVDKPLSAFPHDDKSYAFYKKHEDLVKIHHTSNWKTSTFKRWDVYW
jgi:hypothetical protein